MIPRGAKVRSYPVCERWGVVWIWMGEPAKADTAKIPDLYWLGDPKWTATPGYIHLNSNYQFLIDNLLDLTHVTYVHKKTLAGDPREATTPTRTERLPDGVRVGRWMIDFVPPPLFARAGNFNGNVDRWQFVTWTPPSTVYLDVGCARAGTGAPEGDRSQGISIWSSHLITPETEHSSHYMFSFARDFALADPEMSKLLYEGSKATFLEDAEMLEAVQANRSGGSLEGLVDIAADAAQLQARRMLDQLINAERA
jgi:phenylpropionate dioxygenase-like ring-hydroxylating dioxygenase large terminal subunit